MRTLATNLIVLILSSLRKCMCVIILCRPYLKMDGNDEENDIFFFQVVLETQMFTDQFTFAPRDNSKRKRKVHGVSSNDDEPPLGGYIFTPRYAMHIASRANVLSQYKILREQYLQSVHSNEGFPIGPELVILLCIVCIILAMLAFYVYWRKKMKKYNSGSGDRSSGRQSLQLGEPALSSSTYVPMLIRGGKKRARKG
jgi:hypothetical protein